MPVNPEQADRLKRRIAAHRMILGMSALQARCRDRDGEYTASDLLNEIEAALSHHSPTDLSGREMVEVAARAGKKAVCSFSGHTFTMPDAWSGANARDRVAEHVADAIRAALNPETHDV